MFHSQCGDLTRYVRLMLNVAGKKEKEKKMRFQVEVMTLIRRVDNFGLVINTLQVGKATL